MLLVGRPVGLQLEALGWGAAPAKECDVRVALRRPNVRRLVAVAAEYQSTRYYGNAVKTISYSLSIAIYLEHFKLWLTDCCWCQS